MEEYFEFEYVNEELEFIYKAWINKGHTEIPNKLTCCYLLNSSEKYLFGLLVTFMKGDKRTCFPSIEKLMGYSGWSRRTLKKHMDGLQEAKLFTYIERKGTTNLYRVENLHKSPTIIHSEMLHTIRENHFKRLEGKFNELREEYEKSDLMKEVAKTEHPTLFYEEIEAWFLAGGDSSNEEEVENVVKGLSSIEGKAQPQSNEEGEQLPLNEESQKQPSNGGNLKIQHLKAQSKTSKSVSTMKNSEQFNVSADPDKSPRKKKPHDYKKLEVEEWNTHHFIKYYEDSYKQLLGFELPVQRGDAAQIKALLDRYKHVSLKERIDLFFNEDNFSNLKRNIYTFCSANIQAKLDSLLNYGKSNSYKNNRPTVKESDDPELQEWLKEIGME